MAIRMYEDDPGGSKNSKRAYQGGGSGGGFGGGGGGGNIISLLLNFLPMLMKRPKLLFVVLVVGALFYFGSRGCSSSASANSPLSSMFATGGELNEEIYQETEIYEALADNRKNPLPERVSLEKYCPTPLNQGVQGSCVAWASAYAARTIIEAQRTGKDPNAIKFSPAFMYNQIKLGNDCQGSYIKYAMDNMMEIGAVPFNDFAYTDQSCSKQPGNDLKNKASDFKIKGFQRLTDEKKGKAYEILGMKQNLAKGSPIIIGMMVGGSFMQNMLGKEFWNPTSADYNKRGFGGHAMCVVGYDDYYEGGSFLLMNSWGTDWGKNGFAWIRYVDFKEFNVEAYGLYPMGNVDKVQSNILEGSFALELNAGRQSMGLKQVNETFYESTSKITTSDRFKVEVTNNQECYIYLFGEEENGSVYTLFPYTKKHSPYCGITGTRVFPSDYSMGTDTADGQDKISVLITRKPVNYEEEQQKIANAAGNTLKERMDTVYGSRRSKSVERSLAQSTAIQFKTEMKDTEVLYFTIGINK